MGTVSDRGRDRGRVRSVNVAALVNGNDIVNVIDTVDDQGSTVDQLLNSMMSRCAAHSIAQLAIV